MSYSLHALQKTTQYNSYMQFNIPNTLHPWLTHSGSLTNLLEKKSGQPLIVKPQFEGHQLLTLSEKKLLGMTNALHRPTMAWIREVNLYGNAPNPWIKAKSIFPISSLQGDAKRLQHLNNTPIGYVLFKRNQKIPHHRLIHLDNQHWQRQTVYNWYGRKLLISEIFLDEFVKSL